MKVKVSEATNIQLDWMVAKALSEFEWNLGVKQFKLLRDEGVLAYSTNWAQGGPIIEREHITLRSPMNQLTMNWNASVGLEPGTHHHWDHHPLIAAMRCYVASKLGDEVEVPEELK